MPQNMTETNPTSTTQSLDALGEAVYNNSLHSTFPIRYWAGDTETATKYMVACNWSTFRTFCIVD